MEIYTFGLDKETYKKVVALLALIVFIPIAAFIEYFDWKRLRKTQKTKCPCAFGNQCCGPCNNNCMPRIFCKDVQQIESNKDIKQPTDTPVGKHID
jgi:hypothetical protein